MFLHLLVEKSTHLLKFKVYSSLNLKTKHFLPLTLLLESHESCTNMHQSGSLGLVTTRQEIFMCHYVLVVVVERP